MLCQVTSTSPGDSGLMQLEAEVQWKWISSVFLISAGPSRRVEWYLCLFGKGEVIDANLLQAQLSTSFPSDLQ